MSFFSLIRRGHKAAKEHSAKQAEAKKLEEAKVPYKHVPKHAAIDALSGGPATFRDTDRPKILEQNRRRSAITASGLGMGGMSTPVHHGLPRVHSALSHVSYPSSYASPVVQMPRAYSYHSMAPGWNHQGGEIVYTPIDSSVSLKGKEVERVRVDSGRASRSSSKASAARNPMDGSVSSKDGASVSPVSSNNSNSSQDDLQMKPTKRPVSALPAATAGNVSPSGRPWSENDPSHRLHPSFPRRISDPSRFAPAATRSAGTPPRESRSSSNASLAAAGIPPVPALPPMQFGGSAASSITSITSSASSATVVPVGSTASLSAKIPSPVPDTVKEDEVLNLVKTHSGGSPTEATTPTQRGRRSSKLTRFTELETITSTLSETGPPALTEKTRATTMVSTLPTDFDESRLQQPQLPVFPPAKTGKLTKSAGPKPATKNRWSLRSSKSTAVAV